MSASRCDASLRLGVGVEGEVGNLNLFAQQGFSSLSQYPCRAGRYLQETCLEGRTFAQCPSLSEQVV